jgi:hypothetical protein
VGFTLIDGSVYYATVRAYKTTGLKSSAANGDGFAVNATAATLSCDFTTGTSTDCYAAPSMSTPVPLIQFRRAGGASTSQGTYFNSAGVLVSAAQNLDLNSNDLSNASWAVTAGITRTSAIVAPDGTSTAAEITFPNDTAHSLFQNSNTNVSIGNTITFSVWLKASAPGTIGIEVKRNDGTAYEGNINVVSVTTSWQRFSVTKTLGAAHTIIVGLIRRTQASDILVVDAWGGQLELGSSASPYISTTGTTAYGPRLDSDPSNCPAGVCVRKGLLIESARTNSLLRSGDPSNAAWAIPGGSTMTITGNSTLAPDGTVAATTLTDSDATRTDYIYQHPAVSDSQTWTGSIFIKKDANTARFPALEIAYTGGTTPLTYRVWLNTQTGAVTASNSSTAATIGVTDAGSYWRIWTIAANNATGNNRLDYSIYPAAGTTIGTYSAAATGTAIFWGGQLELGASVSSYIPTTTVALTRNQDIAIIKTLDSNWFDSSKGTLYGSFIMPSATTNQFIADLDDGGGSNRIGMYGTSSNLVVYNILTGGVAQFGGTATPLPLNLLNKSILSYQANDFAGSLNGSTPTTASSGSVPVVNQLAIGSYNSGNFQSNGWIQSIQYFNARLNNSQIKFLSK